MESRINYIIVGIFVILFGVGLAVFAFWLEKYGTYEDFKYYKTFMKESVSGLSREASVKYRGVDVGIVENIRINPENSEEVELLFRIKKETPIKKDMVVILKFYGLTGLAYMEIEGGGRDAALLKSQDDEIPVIKSAPSLYTRLNELIPDIALKLSTVLGRANILLNEENLENTSKLITNIADTSDEVRQLANVIKKSLHRGDYNINKMSSATIEQVNELLHEMKTLIIDLEETVLSIQQNSKGLLLKRTIPKLGPGEIKDNE